LSEENALEVAAKVIQAFIEELGYSNCEFGLLDRHFYFVLNGEKGNVMTEGNV